ncbi:peptide deformylase [bacterium]|nr:peptide deformylase [bacterium]
MSDGNDKVRIYGDPVLRKSTEPVTVFDSDLRDFVEHMADMMFGNNGVGLAAPQVGVSRKVIVIDLSFGEKVDDYLALINPEIVGKEGECTMEEGCLSVPGIWEEVVRPEKIRVRFLDADGAEHLVDADGLLARVIQHEADHLEGILFVDRISTVKRTLLSKTLKTMAEDGIKA